MNARRHEEDSLRTVKKILGIAGVACLVLACTAPAWAGTNQPAGNQASTTPVTGPAQPAAKASPGAPAQAAAPLASTERPKGQHEGITVHGHWTIEVRNPDGKVVTHREFENSLASGTAGGAILLSSILSRLQAQGSWQVVLADTPGQSNSIVITEPGSDRYTYCQGRLAIVNGTPGDSLSCSNSLSLTNLNCPPSGSGGPQACTQLPTVTFTGSGQVPTNFPAAIGYAETDSETCLPSTSPTACATTPGVSLYSFTVRTLDGQGTDPAPVPVINGQTVSVTVVISFGSQ